MIFVLSGLALHFNHQGVELARAYGAPAPALTVPLSGVAIVAGGLSIGLGVFADLGALVVAVFLLPTAYFIHAFWKEKDEQGKDSQIGHFQKNIALAGAALLVFYVFNQLQGDAPMSLPNPLFERAD